MIKKIYLSFVLFSLASLYIFADDCSDALTEAKSLYSNGNYQKAKALFEYVQSECGSSYGDATNWIAKCNDALTPKLSLSRSSVSVGASSGSTSITVTSNRTWELRNTSSSMFSVSKSGNTITIQYYSNSSTSSRSDYFDVVTTDGYKSVRVNFTQSGKSASPSLSVSKTSISASASGTTEYLTVTCNTSWELQYPSGTMYSVTRNGNSLTVKILPNSSTESRSDYFNVKTTDGSKVQKIELKQTGKSSSSSYATINNVSVDHNVYVNGQKGMKIHVKFDAYNVYNHNIRVCVYFYYKGGDALKGISGSDYITPNGKVTVQESSTANYTNTTWNDFTLFMPYSYLNMQSGCKDLSLEGRVGILDKTVDKWLTNENTKFTFTFSN